MAETPSTPADRHCTKCGALLYEGVAWCGMCFEPVARESETTTPPEPEPAVAELGPVAETQERAGSPDQPVDAVAPTAAPASPIPAGWPCPICDSRNPIELDFCATCGASFASLMRQETSVVKVDPQAAFRRSLLFPGLGHRMIPGREVDGFARGVLFAMLLVATLMLGLSGARSGPVLLLFLVYLVASVSVYLLTALEAGRLAQGGDPLVSSRALLWATVAILLLSIIVVALVIGTASRR